jgi:hypothetical protein
MLLPDQPVAGRGKERLEVVGLERTEFEQASLECGLEGERHGLGYSIGPRRRLSLEGQKLVLSAPGLRANSESIAHQAWSSQSGHRHGPPSRRLIYRMLKFGQRYVDKGAEFYEQRYRNQQIQSFTRGRRRLASRSSPYHRMNVSGE